LILISSHDTFDLRHVPLIHIMLYRYWRNNADSISSNCVRFNFKCVSNAYKLLALIWEILKSAKRLGWAVWSDIQLAVENDIIANLYRDTEHDNTIMTEHNIPLYWLYEKLVRLNMYWVVLHVRCLNLTVSLKQPVYARYWSTLNHLLGLGTL
jgi:hypothetical protein